MRGGNKKGRSEREGNSIKKKMINYFKESTNIDIKKEKVRRGGGRKEKDKG